MFSPTPATFDSRPLIGVKGAPSNRSQCCDASLTYIISCQGGSWQRPRQALCLSWKQRRRGRVTTGCVYVPVVGVNVLWESLWLCKSQWKHKRHWGAWAVISHCCLMCVCGHSGGFDQNVWGCKRDIIVKFSHSNVKTTCLNNIDVPMLILVRVKSSYVYLQASPTGVWLRGGNGHLWNQMGLCCSQRGMATRNLLARSGKKQEEQEIMWEGLPA